uniref:Integrase catalytic domain-containing protein n=1 Tax=Paramormyrops kingsleyae TaxID=1676925 RepID=A0A3B3RHQ5_9TELE
MAPLSKAVITSMKAIFTRHGMPGEVFTYNRPQFSNESFRRFAEEWSSCAYNIKSSLPTVKWVSRIISSDAELLVYRTTLQECGMSPDRLLMGRRLRSNLPNQERLLTTQDGEKVRRLKEQQKAKQEFYYDRGTRSLPDLHTGDQERLKDKTNTWAQKGTILNEGQPRSHNVQIEDGAVLRWIRRDIMGPVKAEQRTDDAAGQPSYSENPLPEAQEQPLRRSSRNVEPSERLTEHI